MDEYSVTLKEQFGFDSFRDKQLEVIDAVLKRNNDVCAILFTGAGKSLCFQFPPVHTNKLALVVSPLISLMNDQKFKLESNGIPCNCLNSTIPGKEKVKSEILDNKYRLIYVTPEYLVTQEEFIKELREKDILLTICIDESHCISSWGSDFRVSYKKLNVLKEWFPDIPIMAFTATATPVVQKDIIKTLKLKDPEIIKTTFDRPNLRIFVKQKGPVPLIDLYPLLKDGSPSIVYCQTRKQTENISNLLKSKGIKSGIYHAGINSLERELIHESFINNELSCVVATVAFGMGIDKVIRNVIHYGMPKDMESYYQEIGRAGRDRKRSDCYLFYCGSDVEANNYFINQIKNNTYRLHKMKMTAFMKKYIYSHECRRKIILRYFGEEYKKDNCENCDNCLNKKNIIKKDFSMEAILILTTIYETNSSYGVRTIIDILRGSNSKKIPTKYKKMDFFGKGKYHGIEWWKLFSKMLINIEFIKEKSLAGGYGFLLCRTKKAREWLDKNTIGYKLKKDGKKLLLPLIDEMKIFYDSENSNNDNSKENNILIKGNTTEITYDLFQNKKMSITKIAKERKMKILTIEDHVVKLYNDDKDLDMDRLKFNDNIYKKISKKIKQLNNPKKLKVIKDNLPEVSYLQIKLTQVKMDKIKVKPKVIKIDMDNIEDDINNLKLEWSETQDSEEKIHSKYLNIKNYDSEMIDNDKKIITDYKKSKKITDNNYKKFIKEALH